MAARIHPLAREEMDAEQQRVFDSIVAGPRKGINGPLAVWLHSATFAERAQALGQYCRYESPLGPRLAELAVLVVACFWRAEYEWYVHKPLAMSAGLSSTIVDDMQAGRAPCFEDDHERIVYDVVSELQSKRRINEPLYEKAKAALGQRGVVDLVGIVGYYTLIAMTVNCFEIPLPDGEPSPWDANTAIQRAT